MEQEYGVTIVNRDTELKIVGEPEQVVPAKAVVDSLLALAARGEQISQQNVNYVISLVKDGGCDMLILDEAVDAYQMGLLNAEMFEDFIKNKPPELELIITGHKRENWLIQEADYVTEMVKLKHPYEKGIKARKGIEF